LTKSIPTRFSIFEADRKFVLFFSITQLEISGKLLSRIKSFCTVSIVLRDRKPRGNGSKD